MINFTLTPLSKWLIAAIAIVTSALGVKLYYHHQGYEDGMLQCSANATHIVQAQNNMFITSSRDNLQLSYLISQDQESYNSKTQELQNAKVSAINKLNNCNVSLARVQLVNQSKNRILSVSVPGRPAIFTGITRNAGGIQLTNLTESDEINLDIKNDAHFYHNYVQVIGWQKWYANAKANADNNKIRINE